MRLAPIKLLAAIQLLVAWTITVVAQRTDPSARDPATLYKQLFVDVQTTKIFFDQKTFVDCIPIPRDDLNEQQLADRIVEEYQHEKEKAGFDVQTGLIPFV